MNAVVREIVVAAKQAPRMYFAPVRGLVTAIRTEVKRLSGEIEPERGHVRKIRKTLKQK